MMTNSKEDTMGMRFVLLVGSVVSAMSGSFVGCTTHTHERPDTTVIHEETVPSSSTVREGAREGAREGVRDTTRY